MLLTHAHFDHVGAVAEIAAATGAKVWVPAAEHDDLKRLDALMAAPDGMGSFRRLSGGPPFSEFGPFRPYDAEHRGVGGELLELAGMRFEVIACPGHSPGHVAYAPIGHPLVFSGDVVYRGALGRSDFPGGDHKELLRSLAKLAHRFGPATTFCPGHQSPGKLRDGRTLT